MIQTTKVAHRTIKARDLDVFYRETGPKDAPTVPLAPCSRSPRCGRRISTSLITARLYYV